MQKLMITSLEKKPRIDEHTFMVNEIFYSIQGESTHAGKPCVFVRLTYCNLRCSYCDTQHAFYEGKPIPYDDVLQTVKSYECRTVEITGGEPLLQKPVFRFMHQLCDEGYTVLLETSGSRPVAEVDPRVIKIMDLKCPSSKMVHKNLYENLNYLEPHDELKFVIGTRGDYLWAVDLLRRTRIHKKTHAVLFSPVFGEIEPAQIVEWILNDRLQRLIPNVRIQLQMHKYIWSPNRIGV